MITAYYGATAQFELTEDEFKQAMEAWNNGQGIFLPRIGAYLSKNVIWAGEKPQDPNERYLSDGTRVIKRFGAWTVADDPTRVVDESYYPELKETPQIGQTERVKQLRSGE